MLWPFSGATAPVRAALKTTRSLFVVSDQDSFGPAARITYAHEFTHALQEQYYRQRTRAVPLVVRTKLLFPHTDRLNFVRQYRHASNTTQR
jgi:hypothetical protein